MSLISDSLIGKQLGDFQVREQIGQGGMATVFLAHQISFRRDVALKIIPLGDRASENFRQRFENEAELVASLEHIHILPVYAYGITGEVAYLAMRLLRGGDLAKRLRRGPMGTEEALDLFLQVASGLSYAHSMGVIHRDIKPANILLDNSGNALLADFGLARMIVEDSDLTQSGTLVGTPRYMSPEQLLGQPLDRRSDIYSAAMVLYEMLTGRLPYGGPQAEPGAGAYLQLSAEIESPRQFNPGITPALEEIVLRALRKSPAERYASMEAMAADLERARVRHFDPAAAATSPTESPLHGNALTASRKGRPVKAIVTFAAAIICAAAIYAFVKGGQETGYSETGARVRSGERGVAAEALASGSEIALARKRLGAGGFIAHITCTQRTEYHATQSREMRDIALSDSLPYRIYDSDGDDYRQLTQIEQARGDGARGLIVCPLNAKLLATPLASAQQAAIPLVLMSSAMPSYGGALIASDDYEMGLQAGRFAGEIVAKEMGGKALAIILNYPQLPYLVRRAEGLQQGLLEKAANARIVGYAQGGTREFAAKSVGDLLAGGASFNVILSINDAGSFGAIAAMEHAGIRPNAVLISSIDAEALARQYIRDGYFIRGSVATDLRQFSMTAIGAMVKLLAGSAIPETFNVAPGQVVTRSVLQKIDAKSPQ